MDFVLWAMREVMALPALGLSLLRSHSLLGLGLAKLIEEIGCTLSCQGRKVFCKRVFGDHRLLDERLLLLLRLLLNLLAEEVLNFKRNLFPVVAEFSEHVFEVARIQRLQRQNLKLLRCVLYLVGFLIKKKRQCSLVHCPDQLLIKLLDLCCNFTFLRMHHLRMNLEALAIEGDKLASKSEASSTAWMIPLGSISLAGRLNLRCRKFNYLLCLRANCLCALRSVRQNVCVPFFVHCSDLAVVVLRPCDLLVVRPRREFQLHFAGLDVRNNRPLVFA